MPEFVRIVNVGDRPFDFHHNNVKKRIPPGLEMAVPWALATSLFGDPFAVNLPKKPDRTDSIRRARMNFNYELGMESIESFHARIPKFEVYDMETGQRIYMLLEDPEGEHRGDYVSPDYDSTDRVSILQAQVEMLMSQLQTVLTQGVGNIPQIPTGQTAMVSVDGPEHTEQEPLVKQAAFVGGNAFAQRPEDAEVPPLFDFATLSTSDEPPPTAVFDQVTEDVPAEVGVGSAHVDDAPAPAPRLAKRPK